MSWDLSADDFSCFFRSCGLDAIMIDLLKNEPMKNLKRYVSENNIACDQVSDARIKDQICEAIMADSIEKLSAVGAEICASIIKLVDFPKARLAQGDRLMIHRIMRNFRIDGTGMTDREKCQAIEQHYGSLIKQLKDVQKVEASSGGRFRMPNLKKLLLGLLYVYGTSMTPLCNAQSEQCSMRLATMDGTPFSKGRVFVNGDIRPEVAQLGHDPHLIQFARNQLKPEDGIQSAPVATFLLGGAGAGKTTKFKQIVNANSELREGIKGAVTFNTDDVMETLPGYKAMMDMGVLNGLPVSDQMAADIFHDPAEEINETLLQERVGQGQSFIFDGTGNNLGKLQARMGDLKAQGYTINVAVVTADSNIRQERAEKRSIGNGRWVPAEVVSKGRDPQQWNQVLTQFEHDGLVDAFEIVENN